jgi:hypothetical protein
MTAFLRMVPDANFESYARDIARDADLDWATATVLERTIVSFYFGLASITEIGMSECP